MKLHTTVHLREFPNFELVHYEGSFWLELRDGNSWEKLDLFIPSGQVARVARAIEAFRREMEQAPVIDLTAAE